MVIKRFGMMAWIIHTNGKKTIKKTVEEKTI
jgi:hypothetical protein